MPKEQSLSVPIAIVVAGALVAGALYFSGRGAAPVAQPPDTGGQPTVNTFVPVTSADHILGNPNAAVAVVEYTDLECPFCKQFHTTMQEIMKEYGDNGQVMWVMRDFPLVQLHPNAPKLAEASECVAELGGNTAYWNFLNSIFTQAPVGSFFDMTKLASTAKGVGVPEGAFNTCVTSEKYADHVQKEYADAIAAGGNGTPYSVIVIRKTGKTVGLPGAQPLANVRAAIEEALK